VAPRGERHKVSNLYRFVTTFGGWLARFKLELTFWICAAAFELRVKSACLSAAGDS